MLHSRRPRFERRFHEADHSRTNRMVSAAYDILDDYYIENGRLTPKFGDDLKLELTNNGDLYRLAKSSRTSTQSLVWDTMLDVFETLLEYEDETQHATKLSSEQVKNWFRDNGLDYKEALKPYVDFFDKVRSNWKAGKDTYDEVRQHTHRRNGLMKRGESRLKNTRRVTEGTSNFGSNDGGFPIVAYIDRIDPDDYRKNNLSDEENDPNSEDYVTDYEVDARIADDIQFWEEDARDYWTPKVEVCITNGLYDLSFEPGYYEGFELSIKVDNDGLAFGKDETIALTKEDVYYIFHGIVVFNRNNRLPDEIYDRFYDEYESNATLAKYAEQVEDIEDEEAETSDEVVSATEKLLTKLNDELWNEAESNIWKLIDAMTKEGPFIKLGVAHRFDNGDTGYSQIESKSEAAGRDNVVRDLVKSCDDCLWKEYMKLRKDAKAKGTDVTKTDEDVNANSEDFVEVVWTLECGSHKFEVVCQSVDGKCEITYRFDGSSTDAKSGYGKAVALMGGKNEALDSQKKRIVDAAYDIAHNSAVHAIASYSGAYSPGKNDAVQKFEDDAETLIYNCTMRELEDTYDDMKQYYVDDADFNEAITPLLLLREIGSKASTAYEDIILDYVSSNKSESFDEDWTHEFDDLCKDTIIDSAVTTPMDTTKNKDEIAKIVYQIELDGDLFEEPDNYGTNPTLLAYTAHDIISGIKYETTVVFSKEQEAEATRGDEFDAQLLPWENPYKLIVREY